MATLNRAAAEVLERMPAGVVHGCTDVTGFGLIGHASEMAAASGCSLEIRAAQVPLLDGARSLVQGNIPGGARTNREHFEAGVTVAPGIDPVLIDLLYDPQTSGGLLIAVSDGHATALLAALAAAGVLASLIGRVLPSGRARIAVV
jgi:selenide,water dikinase